MTKCERFPVPAGSFGSAHPGYLKRCNASSSRLSETCLSEEVIERTWSVLYLDEGLCISDACQMAGSVARGVLDDSQGVQIVKLDKIREAARRAVQESSLEAGSKFAFTSHANRLVAACCSHNNSRKEDRVSLIDNLQPLVDFRRKRGAPFSPLPNRPRLSSCASSDTARSYFRGFDAEVESLETSERNKSVGNISFSSEQQCIPDGGMRQRSSSEGLLVPRIPSARAGIASPRVRTNSVRAKEGQERNSFGLPPSPWLVRFRNSWHDDDPDEHPSDSCSHQEKADFECCTDTLEKQLRAKCASRAQFVPSPPRPPPTISYVSVFDGHNGYDAAESSRVMLHHFLADSLSTEPCVSHALRTAYRAVHEFLTHRHTDLVGCDACGATATTLVVVGSTLTVANLGDSQAFLFDKSGVATACTTMHHMSNPDEAKHVEAADGEIVNMMGVLRIEGCTVLTRCLGFQKLDGILRREPDVFETELTADSDFAIVASDGLWDVVSADDAFALMQQLRAEIKDDPSFCDLDAKETAVLAAEALVDEAELRGSADDVSVAVVMFQ
ncbi:putative protein phosphatase 2C 52 [Diplonema papillatum]|nr:putative protein phosphatase 2C 52 [Diplonema papillatum]